MPTSQSKVLFSIFTLIFFSCSKEKAHTQSKEDQSHTSIIKNNDLLKNKIIAASKYCQSKFTITIVKCGLLDIDGKKAKVMFSNPCMANQLNAKNITDECDKHKYFINTFGEISTIDP